MTNLGKLKKTLSEKCPECSHPLQLRSRKTISLSRGVELEIEEEYKVCSVCDYEREIPLRDRKKRVEHVDKTAYVKELETKRRYVKDASDKKRSRFTKSNGKSG